MLTLAQNTEAAAWVNRVNKQKRNLSQVLLLLDEFLKSQLPYYQVLDRIYEIVLGLDPSLETLSLVCEKLHREWQHFPDEGYGFWDTPLEGSQEYEDAVMRGTRAFFNRKREAAIEAAAEASDFDSALKVLRLDRSIEVQRRVHELASTPDHAMAWLALNENGNITRYSIWAQGKFLELATRDDVRLEMLRQGAFDQRVLDQLRDQLAASQDPIVKYALANLTSRRRWD